MFLGLSWGSTTWTAVGWTMFDDVGLKFIHQDLKFELVKPGVCVCVFKYTLPPRCTFVGRFYFVVHVLCTRLCCVRSWLHCWANWGALCVCVGVFVCSPRLITALIPAAWHPLSLSEEGIWSGACCQPEPWIIFKEVSPGVHLPPSVSFQRHGSPALACRGSLWYARHAPPDLCSQRPAFMFQSLLILIFGREFNLVLLLRHLYEAEGAAVVGSGMVGLVVITSYLFLLF